MLSRELKKEVRCPDELMKIIRDSPITPPPVVDHLWYTWDWRKFITPHLTEKMLKNHSFYHSFRFKKEKGVTLFRGKKYPHSTEWLPEEGIKLINDDVEFSSVGASEFRIDTLCLDKVYSDLSTKYYPTLDPREKIAVEASWDKLQKELYNLPNKQKNLLPMRINQLPKQAPKELTSIPTYLHPFLSDQSPALIGSHGPTDLKHGEFSNEIRPGMDVVVYTESKENRPWIGTVQNVVDGDMFELHWFEKKGKSGEFQAMFNKDGSKYTSILPTGTVMLWELSEYKDVSRIVISKFWLDKINEAYQSHDFCYM